MPGCTAPEPAAHLSTLHRPSQKLLTAPNTGAGQRPLWPQCCSQLNRGLGPSSHNASGAIPQSRVQRAWGQGRELIPAHRDVRYGPCTQGSVTPRVRGTV
ncbi:uroplakin-1b [Platysternon megacephalum]|uniref:Uroplakin-1b n=1 Tax=Platysternon megacephalum TaxID=55544 RepID=A0A4D9E7U4_9SAUR|nr:uroplakin-1b [Platysternon megacephalum]